MGGNHDTAQDVAVNLPGRLRKWLTGLQLSQLWQLAIVLVLVVTAAFGGLDTVDKRVTDAEKGKPFSDGEFTVTVDRASLLPEVLAGPRVIAHAEAGHRYLGVVTRLRNDGTIPGSILHQLDLQDQPDGDFVGSWRLSDGEPVTSIGPGLAEELAFIWKLPESAVQQDDSVTLRIWKKQFVELLTTYGKAWIPSATDYTRIVVPVKVQP
jgi:hypothetical protein